jgi:Tfp pilus assembly protein PilV
MNARRSVQGFTLIETLVAFTIAATSLALLFRINAASNGTAALAEEYVQATALARSLLAEHNVTERAVTFSRSGVELDKYRWRVRGERSREATDVQATPGMAFAVREMTVEIEWESRDRVRAIELHTAAPLFPEIDE